MKQRKTDALALNTGSKRSSFDKIHNMHLSHFESNALLERTDTKEKIKLSADRSR